jgi:transposase-like protein
LPVKGKNNMAMEAGEKRVLKKEYSPQQKASIIESWNQSGKSRMEFSREHGINYHTLIFWTTPKKKRSKELPKAEREQGGFSEVKLPPKSSDTLFARISFGQTSVDIFQPVNPDFLRRILHA